ncbi:hypothetical protein HanXRQr2_Chr11g0489331 [Helianthus annuus]|uniref:Uncharacterized protein n=1 Tax=Helianthus annuus TaxID=4232 RepID=A0A9K3HPE8_HELAN|nr:hypothetical protein HanXRQr2_Chr11g0489331 [Helianthus annuus]KAJ0509252.1 hypothetical protein HanIR_Chr11g0526751 [Helianthus annuus]KAJ0875048.1 hypothetical protein HanPSC8_Chr11g0471611 [Helianthus annuus]
MKGPLTASLIRSPEMARAPNRNVLLLLQLELSVKKTSPNSPTPSFRTTASSPATSGLLPSLAHITLASNSF